MFPYVHICFAKDVLGRLNDEIVLGSVFPDTVIAGHLEHGATHRPGQALYRYLVSLGQFSDFACGVVTHSTVPAGLDYYCDEKYLGGKTGYAFAAAAPLVEQVIDCCHLPPEMGLWKAHNFIEMAADLWLYQNRSDCYGALAQALTNEKLIFDLSQILSPFFEVPVSRLAMSFPVYGEFVTTGEVTPLKLAEKYGLQMNRKHNININVDKTADVISEAEKIVSETFPAFYQACLKEVSGLIDTMAGRSK